VFLVAYAGPLDFSRLFTYRDFTGSDGGNVWPTPFSPSPYYILALGLLHVVYTMTGYDTSAHMAEESTQARVASARQSRAESQVQISHQQWPDQSRLAKRLSRPGERFHHRPLALTIH
jgi:hypothetical protein